MVSDSSRSDPLQKLPNQTVYNRAFIILVLIALLLLAAITTNLQLRSVANDIQEDTNARVALAEQNNKILNTLKDCTTPQGKCYQRSNDRTGSVVGTINQVSVFAAYCASVEPPPVNVQAVEQCVKSQLERANAASTLP